MHRSLLAFVVLGGALHIWLALVEAPSFAGRVGFTAPLSWKLFFFHVPIAFVSFTAFAVAFYHALHFLVRQEPTRDRAAQSAVESGVLFAGLTLVTGMIWGKAEWGVAWRWEDAKLVVVLVMFFTYAGYLVLRQQIDDPERRARVSSVYALLGFVTVPLAWFAQRIWLSFHPTVFGPDRPDAGIVAPGVFPIFLLGLAVFLAVFAQFHLRRRDQLDRAAALHALPEAPA